MARGGWRAGDASDEFGALARLHRRDRCAEGPVIDLAVVGVVERGADLRHGFFAAADVHQTAADGEDRLAVLFFALVTYVAKIDADRIHLHARRGIDRRGLRP